MGRRKKILVANEKSQEVHDGDAMDRLHTENDQMRQQMQDLHKKNGLVVAI